MIDEAYEKFNKMKKQDYEILKQLCNCENCKDKDDEDGLYKHCAHFSTCATDIILKIVEEMEAENDTINQRSDSE